MEPVVRVEAVDFFYGKGSARNQVLFGNSLTIRPGQLVVMTGPSGSGKTTLLTLIGTLRSLQGGWIEVLGRNLAALAPRELGRVRRGIGFIFQLHNLFDSLSAYENVKLALQLQDDLSGAEMRQRGVEMLERLGLGNRLDSRPHSLSGGERQRVAIARALVNRPKLVLADEPTAALDKDAARNLVQLLKRMTEEEATAILLVTHDHRIIELADRLVHMVDGRIVSDILLNDSLRICEFLKGIEAFKNLSPNELANVADRMSRRQFMPGEVIIRQGDVGEDLFLIAEGEVQIERGGREVTRLGAGEFFGELAVMSANPRNATVVATKPVDAYVLGVPDFDAALAASQGFRDQLRHVYFQRH
jgi:putative ABC transport system ATP-binding protein